VVGGTTASNPFGTATSIQTFSLGAPSPTINTSFDVRLTTAGNGEYLYVFHAATGAADNNYIAQYRLSTPYDISTATYVASKQITGTGGLSPVASQRVRGIKVAEDGSAFRVWTYYGNGSDVWVGGATMATPYSITTSTWSAGMWDIIANQGDVVKGATSTSDGNYTFYARTNGTVEVSVGSAGYGYPGAINSSYTSSNLGFTNPTGIVVKDDGLKACVLDSTSNTLYYYTLSTAYDWSTASQDGTISFTSIGGLSTVDNLSRLYTFSSNNTVQEYEIAEFTPYTLTLPASVQNSDYYPNEPQPLLSSNGDRYLFEFVTTDGGTNVWKVGSTKYDDN
jgi:hypothetical protein